MDKHLLEVRISILIKRNGVTFLTTFKEFQGLLKEVFKEDYSLDEIESALHIMEEQMIEVQYEEERNRQLLNY